VQPIGQPGERIGIRRRRLPRLEAAVAVKRPGSPLGGDTDAGLVGPGQQPFLEGTLRGLVDGLDGVLADGVECDKRDDECRLDADE